MQLTWALGGGGEDHGQFRYSSLIAGEKTCPSTTREGGVRPFTLFDVSTQKNNEQQNSQEQQKTKRTGETEEGQKGIRLKTMKQQ